MATSPNYAWAEPDNSSLVKNGAADIRTLGDAIDTSLWNVGFGQAGKNKVINGDFGIWQRGTSFTSLSTDVYTADRWRYVPSGATATVSRETFSPGAAPVAGYESQYFLRVDCTVADDNWGIYQKVEDVRTFAGQTITISFWAKSSVSLNVYAQASQDFGSGGSAGVFTNSGSQATTTNWVRYSHTIAVPSILGKTVGANSNLQIGIRVSTNTTGTLDIWGVQAEYGSKASPFQTASGGSLQAELAMCQRYYTRFTGSSSTAVLGINGFAASTTLAIFNLMFPVQMRVAPSTLDFNNLAFYNFRTAATLSGGTFVRWQSYRSTVQLRYTHGSGVFAINDQIDIVGAAAADTYIGLSAEL